MPQHSHPQPHKMWQSWKIVFRNVIRLVPTPTCKRVATRCSLVRTAARLEREDWIKIDAGTLCLPPIAHCWLLRDLFRVCFKVFFLVFCRAKCQRNPQSGCNPRIGGHQFDLCAACNSDRQNCASNQCACETDIPKRIAECEAGCSQYVKDSTDSTDSSQLPGKSSQWSLNFFLTCFSKGIFKY